MHPASRQTQNFDGVCINTIRTLAADTVSKAKSGHPGAPMGMAPMAHVLWGSVMNYAPQAPQWPNRDRFVLSNGHACALLYSMLHLTGYTNMTMNDLKNFRQLHSRTPGHPESHMTEGVEVTTGPLGQGIANAVGLAVATRHMAATFNKPNFDLFNNFTYVFCGDGCLQEGISGEAASMAGHLGLGNLIVLYDDNNITIDGDTDLSFTENVPQRFASYGWQTITVENGDHNIAGLAAAIAQAKEDTKRPTIISVKTTIGFGAGHLEGTHSVHGSPLKPKDLKESKERLGMDGNAFFAVSDQVYQFYRNNAAARGNELAARWARTLDNYCTSFPREGKELRRRLNGELPADWRQVLPAFAPGDKAVATRSLSGKVLVALAEVMPELIGGSADLTPSNKTQIKSKDFQKKTPEGRYLRFGVREHAMAAIGNGLAAFGGLIPFTATFLNFIEYLFPALRLAALSETPQIFIMTHDSVALGEDGPTHQPIEAIAMCRATPNVLLLRPADGNETVGAYISSVTNKTGPSVLCLSRQNLPQLKGSCRDKAQRGGYVLNDDAKDPTLILVASGSEVSLAVEAASKLTAEGKHRVRVVSMPSTTLFDQQPTLYRRQVLIPGVPTIAIECGSRFGWDKYAHFTIGMDSFGVSAPGKQAMSHFGFEANKVVKTVNTYLHSLNQELTALGYNSVSPLATQLQSNL